MRRLECVAVDASQLELIMSQLRLCSSLQSMFPVGAPLSSSSFDSLLASLRGCVGSLRSLSLCGCELRPSQAADVWWSVEAGPAIE